MAWCDLVDRHGTLPLESLLRSAIRHARDGYAVSPSLRSHIVDGYRGIVRDPGLEKVFSRDGKVPAVGDRIVMDDYAETLKLIARMGKEALYTGGLGGQLVQHCAASGGYLLERDLASYEIHYGAPLVGRYGDYSILAPPRPCLGGWLLLQMMERLEARRGMFEGFSSARDLMALYEAISNGLESRCAILSDSRTSLRESSDTTHVTVSDAWGGIVSSTQSIHDSFGAMCVVPGTGLIANNYMAHFGEAGRYGGLGVRRVQSSMAPIVVLHNGVPLYALGLPGGVRIFGALGQILINLFEYGMPLPMALDAPRIWGWRGEVEIERPFGSEVVHTLRRAGLKVQLVENVGGGASGVELAGGRPTGATCWRGDGVAVGVGKAVLKMS